MAERKALLTDVIYAIFFRVAGRAASCTVARLLRLVQAPELLRQPAFARLWFGQTVSTLGSQVTLIAFPLVAIDRLHAGVDSVSTLRALGTLPYVLATIPLAVWADRLPAKRPLLIAADVARALFLATIPVAAALGFLALPQLFLIAFANGVATALSGVSAFAFLPSLVAPDQLGEANSLLVASFSTARIAGPAFGGVLVAAVGAATAISADVVSFFVSALMLLTIAAEVPRPARLREGFVREMTAAVRFYAHDAFQRALALNWFALNLCGGGVGGLLIFYFRRTLQLDDRTIGLIFAVGSCGAVLGATANLRLQRLLGRPRLIVITIGALPITLGLIGLASGPPPVLVAILLAADFLEGVALTIFNIQAATLRQTSAEPGLLARVAATWTVWSYTAWTLGALAGGVIATYAGPRPVIVGAGVVAITATPLLRRRIPAT